MSIFSVKVRTNASGFFVSASRRSRAPSTFVPSARVTAVFRARPPSLEVRQPPISLKFSSANPMVHRLVACRADRVGAMRFHLFAHGSRRRTGLRLRQSGNVGRRRGNRQTQNVLEHPFAAQHGRSRVGMGRHHQHSAFPSSPRRSSSTRDTRRKSLPNTPGMPYWRARRSSTNV